MKKTFTFKAVSVYLVAALLVIGMMPRAEAGFVSSTGTSSDCRAADIAAIQKALERKIVSETLHKMGYTNAEIQSRLAGMTDQELHLLASRIDDAKAAGDGAEVLIIALFIVIIVLLALYLTGHRVVIR